jgi:hypothetical protein
MRKATLMIPVYYDEDKTDGESIASAFDTLLETAMSTAGVLDEYADPEVGEFSLEFDTRWPEESGDVQHLVRLGPVDGPEFARQRELVLCMGVGGLVPLELGKQKDKLLDGLTNFLDVIADQLHDRYGISCLMADEPTDSEE